MERKIRIVVADDHQPFRDALIHLLSLDADIDVVGAAADGREAYDLCMNLHPDVVLMDLVMPGVDGATATRYIKQEAPETKVIMFSVFNQERYIRRGAEAGVDRYLPKGISREELLATVKAVAEEAMAAGETADSGDGRKPVQG
ncbi:MAG: response regulator transcription factor [Thermoleophilia bacterium]|nr:response regulator transcription factor [Thermoleophilia bacterium]